MRPFLLIVLATAGLAACGSKSSPDPVAELTGLRDKMCGCTDAACAGKLDPAVTAWGTRHDKALGAKDEVKTMVARIALCKENASGDPLAREILETLGKFRDRACACTDAPCAEQVEHDQGSWLVEHQARLAGVKSTKTQNDEANAIAAQTEKCARKVLKTPPAPGGGEAPPAPPPATP